MSRIEDERISDLEGRIVELEAQISERDDTIALMEGELAEARRHSARPAPTGSFPMPGPTELARLRRVVIDRYAQLQCDIAEFRSAFAFVATLAHYKANKFSKLANVSWCDRAREWLRENGMDTEMSL